MTTREQVLVARLAVAGVEVTWPGCWACVAAALGRGAPVPEMPSVYDPALLRALHCVDAELARAVMRAAGGWSAAPHDDTDFHQVLALWEHGHPDACAEDEDHFVAACLSGFGRDGTRGRIDVARCKDCGLAVYAIGHAWRLNHQDEAAEGWRRVWPGPGDRR